MPVKLIDPSSTYEWPLPLKDEAESEWPVLRLRKLSAEEVNRIEDKLVVSKPGSDDSFGYLTGTANRLKIDSALVDWSGIFDANGNPAKCTSETKKRLPAFVQTALIEHIDKVNGLTKNASRIDYEKNSGGQPN